MSKGRSARARGAGGSRWSLACLAPVALVALVALCACKPPPAPSGPSAPPQVTLIGARMSVFQGETLAASGRAAKLTYRRESGDVVANEALVQLPRATATAEQRGKNAPGIELRAAEMTGNLGTRQSAASGGVQMKSADGTSGVTPSATFDGTVQKARGEEPIRLTGTTGWTLEASSFEFLLPEERFVFFGDVVTRSSPQAPGAP